MNLRRHEKKILWWLALWLCCWAIIPATAQVSVVVAKNSRLASDKTTKAEVKEIFAGAKLKWKDGAKIRVVDQPQTNTGAKFYKAVLGASPTQVHKQWLKLLLSGQASAPLQVTSDKEVKQMVSRHAHAIGYIATGSLDDSVREILRLE